MMLTGPLAHSMFQHVLFPTVELENATGEQDVLCLRRHLFYKPALDIACENLDYVVFDLETTGLDVRLDRIIEFGAARIRGGKVIAEFSSLVSTHIQLTEQITRLTGISQDMLVGQPSIEEILPRFIEFIQGAVLVAHNAEFDFGMLRSALGRVGFEVDWPCFCTVKLSRQLLPELPRHNLDVLAQHFALSFEARHRAVGDVKVLSAVLLQLLENFGDEIPSWRDLQPFTIGT